MDQNEDPSQLPQDLLDDPMAVERIEILNEDAGGASLIVRIARRGDHVVRFPSRHDAKSFALDLWELRQQIQRREDDDA